MHLCRLLARAPLLRPPATLTPRPHFHPRRWLAAQRNYSTALDESPTDEQPPPQALDIHNLPADSAFLDYILGPEKPSSDETLRARDDGQQEEEERNPAAEYGIEHTDVQPRTRRERLRQLSQQRGDEQNSPALTGFTITQRPPRELQRRLTPKALRSRRTELERSSALHQAGIHVRHKWVSMRTPGSRTTFFSSFWNMAMANLQRRYNKKWEMHYMKPRREPSVLPEASAWAKTALEHVQEDKPAVYAGLYEDSIPSVTGLRHWQHAALWLVHHEPERVVDFLRIGHVARYPPAQCIADLLSYLAAHFTELNDESTPARIQALAEVFPLLAERSDNARLPMDSSFFAQAIPYCTDYQVHQLYQAIKRHRVGVLAHTYLQFATYFSKNERFGQALDALLSAKNRNIDLDSWQFRSNCTTLLRNAIRHPDGLRMCLRIVDNLVNMGLTLNNNIANVIMLNAVEARDLNTAFSIYESLTQHGLEADKYTFAILLKGCKTNIDDAEALNKTIRGAIENAHVDVLHEPLLASEILHCLALHHTKHHPDRAFETVADAYAQMFDLAPLRRLGISLPKLSQTSDPLAEQMQPNQAALHVMITTYLEYTYKTSDSTLPAYELWKRYRVLAEANVEPFATSLQYDYIPNSFLETFIKTRKGLLYATEVIKAMQKPSDPEACKPTVQTWSIFLNGFSRHRQFAMAEQILTYMRGKGIEPNEVTYNSLAAGYAAAQETRRLFSTLERMEAEEKTWTAWTWKNLGLYREQGRLMEWLEGRREAAAAAARLDFTGELKEDLYERIKGVGEEGEEEGGFKAEEEGGEVGFKAEEVMVEGMADSPGELAEIGMDDQKYQPM